VVIWLSFLLICGRTCLFELREELGVGVLAAVALFGERLKEGLCRLARVANEGRLLFC
jgi:hypothetical protein